jgi:serpin B
MKSVIIIASLLLIVSTVTTAQAEDVPDWVKNNAKWWADGSIDDNSFVQGIQFLIKEGIMKIPPTTQGSGIETNEIPSWIKNTAKFWAEENISDTEFINALQYLVKEGILVIPSDGPESKEYPSISDDKEYIYSSAIVEANNQFSFEFYNQVATDNDENVFFSPLSVSTAFAVAYEGTRGETAEEISDVFGFQTNDSERRSSFKNIIKNLNDPDFTLNIANALWLAQDFKPLSSYVETSKTYYESEINTVDFVSDEGVHTVNEWVKEKTENKIKQLLSPGSTDDNTRLVITNAIYFKGTWVNPFNEERTRDADFKINSDQTVQTPMMFLGPTTLNYTENEQLEILELPYKGYRLSMLILLPKEVDGIHSLEESFTLNNFSEWKKELSEKHMAVFLPKFTFDTDYNLKRSLQNMGIKAAFDQYEADFGGITETEDLYIAFAIHKAFVDVNEVGTEAAAVTGIGVSATSVPPTFNADHPFIFIIQDNETGNILFMGRVINPSS